MAVVLIHQLLYRFVLAGKKFHLNKHVEIQEACVVFTNKITKQMLLKLVTWCLYYYIVKE